MADIELVIKIPDFFYTQTKSYVEKNNVEGDILSAVAHGTPLPKGHGNLVDENQVVASLVFGNLLKENIKCGQITEILDRATIIEADKED